ncbi:MAG: Hcp family type VI secretion system effector [Sedimentisphaerales bacterium]|nr:Hcp family type VI secretion system effector [Sedimentisphaerales bacterium]
MSTRQTKGIFLFLLIAAILSQPSRSALNAYLTLQGEMQGDIEGSVTQAGREGQIMVIATSHSVTSPRDAASGLPTGKRQHQPFRITKEIDRSTPLLMNALVNNEKLTQFELRYWQPSATGKEVQYYTVILHDAYIVSIQQEMLNNKYPENMQHKEREHVSFMYRAIEWVYEDGGIAAGDDWSYSGGFLLSDLTGDGFVNLLDLAILAEEWMQEGRR